MVLSGEEIRKGRVSVHLAQNLNCHFFTEKKGKDDVSMKYNLIFDLTVQF